LKRSIGISSEIEDSRWWASLNQGKSKQVSAGTSTSFPSRISRSTSPQHARIEYLLVLSMQVTTHRKTGSARRETRGLHPYQ
jgi:hypothetical protein